jgi:hypothetical protein
MPVIMALEDFVFIGTHTDETTPGESSRRTGDPKAGRRLFR